MEAQRREARLVAEGLVSLGERMDHGFAEVRGLVAAHRRSLGVSYPDLVARLGLEERG